MLTTNQQKTLSRLGYLFEFAPCNTNEFDYLLKEKGFVKIDKYGTELTQKGINHLSHLVEENRL